MKEKPKKNPLSHLTESAFFHSINPFCIVKTELMQQTLIWRNWLEIKKNIKLKKQKSK
jgi:hypothetical protein